MSIKLFVANFPLHITEIELLEVFSQHALVSDLTIVKDGSKSRGYGFVILQNQIAADRVIEALNGRSIGDRKLSVRIAENKSTFLKTG
ncbi:RNA recognition motif-containing protein [Pedobacter africanus]|uniref:RNA recognition motif-containing protein n=1 Tax=Pedobacter africanus TaxID=151894 RepID=A0ACC6KT82_9SPHI|nr:RNA-binding protein [Pedobacter africanus]MDR6782347.1 RNA recognition motif-containing protein [Pedobacter africanus]